jgi:anti-anti-sigma factor
MDARGTVRPFGGCTLEVVGPDSGGRDDGTVVVVVGGDIDAPEAAELESTLLGQIDAASLVVVDLGGAAHFGSRGLTALLRTQDAAARRGTRLHVSTGGRRHIRRPLEITGIDAIVPVFATVTDALAGSPLVRS